MNTASDLPTTLNHAIATELLWLQAWGVGLVVTNLAALLSAEPSSPSGHPPAPPCRRRFAP